MESKDKALVRASILLIFFTSSVLAFGEYDVLNYDVGNYGTGEIPPPPPPEPPPSSPSGGGGPAKNITAVNKVQSINTTTPVEIRIEEPRVDFLKITLYITQPSANVRVTFVKINEPRERLDEVNRSVYQYASMSITNATPGSIAYAKIRFRVLKSWIFLTSYSQHQIILKQFSNGVWANLPTTLVAGDPVYNEYEATASAVESSLFAIVAERPVVVEKAAPDQLTEGEEGIQRPAEAREQKEPEIFYVMLIYLLVGVVITLSAVLLLVVHMGRRSGNVIIRKEHYDYAESEDERIMKKRRAFPHTKPKAMADELLGMVNRSGSVSLPDAARKLGISKEEAEEWAAELEERGLVRIQRGFFGTVLKKA